MVGQQEMSEKNSASPSPPRYAAGCGKLCALILTKKPGLKSIEEKCLSYSFIHEVYENDAYHTNFIQNLKIVKKNFNEHFRFFAFLKLSGQ